MLLAFKLSSQDSVPSSKEKTAGSCSEVGAVEIPPDERVQCPARSIRLEQNFLEVVFPPEGTDFSKEIIS
ncbi:MAG: hypothetical protein E5W72_14900 [Mesorhizobium sp.]|nr:MAG: hypothetical protein E5W87_11620 [Mesorhizobium sp.]TIT49847.1 MAG: hypothetical protein E5W72_14900 [Mesorhizobium sp.]